MSRCETTSTSAWASRDCYTTCEGALCNSDMSVTRLFEPALGETPGKSMNKP